MVKEARMKTVRALLILSMLAIPLVSAAEVKGKVLMILSNGASVGDFVAKNNLWEYAEPHHIFVMHGLIVDFVSPHGGPVSFSLDADETDPPGIVHYTIKYEGFRQKADRTLKPDAIGADNYAAVFIGGGTGTMFDVAEDARLLSIIARVYENGGIVGGGGHGPGSLGNVKLSDGRYLVAGRRVTGFPNSTEGRSKSTRAGTLLPFRVEDRLRARGALFVSKEELADKHDVVIDGKIVTAMFLPSSAAVAQEMVNLMKQSSHGFSH
jgi:putative intracellular protease/amidase